MPNANLFRWIKATLRQAAWAPSLVFLLHVFLAQTVDIYARLPAFDIPMHFVGGMAIALFFHRASINASRFGVLGPFHPVTHVILVFSLVCAAAMFWEFAEFTFDRVFGAGHQLGLDDTILDMFLGALGGATFLVMHRVIHGPAVRSEEPAETGDDR